MIQIELIFLDDKSDWLKFKDSKGKEYTADEVVVIPKEHWDEVFEILKKHSNIIRVESSC